MGHIHLRTGEHDHVVSAFIVRTDGVDPKLMLHRHKKLGKMLQFGGHIELMETPWQALVHELQEESGYDIDQLRILQPRQRILQLAGATLHPVPMCYSTHAFSRTHSHTDTSFAFVTAEEPRHPRADGESDEIVLVTNEELVTMTDEQIFENVRQIGSYALTTCLDTWEAVPTSTFQLTSNEVS